MREKTDWRSILYAVLAVVGLTGSILALASCSSNTTDPTALVSPSPAPSPTQHVLLTIRFYQDGQLANDKGVQAGHDFKVQGDARWFDSDDKPITGPFIPYWNVEQTTGAGTGQCSRFFTETDNYALFLCLAPVMDAEFKVCALDWDHVQIGECVHGTLNIG